MSATFEILRDVARCNPHITHFCLRLYKHTPGNATDPKSSTAYKWLPVEHISNIKKHILNHEKAGWSVGLTSKIKTTQGLQYLLLLDYSCAPSRTTEKELRSQIKLFNQSGDVPYALNGFLIRTTHSYHYLGLYPTSRAHLINFFGSALLFPDPVTGSAAADVRWIGHSIKRGFGAIRIGRKNGVYARVVCRVG